MPTKRVKGKKKLKSIKAKVTDVMGSKRRLSRFGKEQKKGMRGATANYLSRSQTLKKLQISLKDFRRLCILKGIYPREPSKKKKQQQGADKTYYHIKDIMYLAHEPLLEHFRSFKTFLKKVISSIGRKNYDDARRRHEHRPSYTLDHLVKERYPRFTDALADLDDALCLIHLFASMPSGKVISSEETEKCVRLVREWQEYNVITNSLDKVFVSIKGIYYQSTVKGEKITWLVPHAFTPTVSKRVDLHVMVTFLEFYQVLLKFVNYQLYSELGLQYPPKINAKFDQAGLHLSALEVINAKNPDSKECEMTDGEETVEESQGTAEVAEDSQVVMQQKESESRVDSLDTTLKNAKADESIDHSDEENDTDIIKHKALTEPLEAAFASNELAVQLFENAKKETCFKKLFENFVFFLSREVPRVVLEFVLRSYGARIGWEGPGSPFDETSEYITHHIVDRPHQGHRYFNREYIQPQWVFDTVNNKALLPIAPYAPGMDLPPHLSPFVDDEKEGYVPEYRKQVRSAAQVLRSEMARKDGNGHEQDDDESEDEEEAYLAGIRAELQESRKENDDDSQAIVSTEEDASNSSMQEPVAKQDPTSRVGRSKKKKVEKLQQEAKESHDMAKNMMSKKAKRLYDRMQYGLGKKSEKIQLLEAKRARLQQQNGSN